MSFQKETASGGPQWFPSQVFEGLEPFTLMLPAIRYVYVYLHVHMLYYRYVYLYICLCLSIYLSSDPMLRFGS